jgi:hypothetical protein
MQKELNWFTPKILKNELERGSWYLVKGTTVYDGRFVDMTYFWKWQGEKWFNASDSFGLVIKAVAKIDM